MGERHSMISEFAHPGDQEFDVVMEIKREIGRALQNAVKGFQPVDQYRFALAALETSLCAMVKSMKPEHRLAALDDIFAHMREEVARWNEEDAQEGRIKPS